MAGSAPSAKGALPGLDPLGIGFPIVNRDEADMICRNHAAGRAA
jgi:hypothetical protein